MVVKDKAHRSQDMKILADGKVMKVQKTRQRKILSCVYCHSKKIRCSRVQPICNNCDKLGIECKYFINERVSRGGKKLSRTSSTSEPTPALAQFCDEKKVCDPLKAQHLQQLQTKSEQHLQHQEPSPHRSLVGSLSETGEHRTDSVSSYSDGISSISPKSNSNSLDESITTNDDIVLTKNDPQISDLYMGLSITPQDETNLARDDNGPSVAKSSGNGNEHDLSNFNTSLLQTPVLNTMSNNITNNYFNTNYASAANDDPFDLNTYSFNQDLVLNGTDANSTLYGSSQAIHKNQLALLFNKNNNAQVMSNFIDSQAPNNGTATSLNPSSNSQLSQPNNPALHNSLNACSSNPATTQNFLYGTNTNYNNELLLHELITCVPESKERSYELVNRYINSVHILLPIIVNLQDFVSEHHKYWDIRDSISRSSSVSSPSSATSPSHTSFNFLQFYTIYFPILYASTISEFEEYDNLLLNQDISKYLRSFNKICQYYNYPHGLKSISLLLGNVIIQLTSPNPSSMEMSQIIRYAKFLHLHRDPVISLGINDWEVVKFRRLIWWVIFGLDALSSHNFCLPPVCKFDDFNVLLPDDEDPVFNEGGQLVEKKLNVSILSINAKFKFDRILSELVFQLHNGLSNNISESEINRIKGMIVDLYGDIHLSIQRMTQYCKVYPPQTVQEMNLMNFIKNHSWSFVDRALMLLHKKILTGDATKNKNFKSNFDLTKPGQVITTKESTDSQISRGGKNSLSFNQFEDTFGELQEANIVSNFDSSSISQLKFNQHKNFLYENLNDNLIPSILHNLNDFLKYNDFIKFGKFNWYIKRTIPIDSVILMFIIITVKLKYEFMTVNELILYVKLINKTLYILNRKWFKNEKYKRMLSLTNLSWKFILMKYNIIGLMNHFQPINKSDNLKEKVEFFDYQVSSVMNMSELFNVMNVPQPVTAKTTMTESPNLNLDLGFDNSFEKKSNTSDPDLPNLRLFQNVLITKEQLEQNYSDATKTHSGQSQGSQANESELIQLSEKIYYDLRNNFVDINDYCSFYSSLEKILHELMDYIHSS